MYVVYTEGHGGVEFHGLFAERWAAMLEAELRRCRWADVGDAACGT